MKIITLNMNIKLQGFGFHGTCKINTEVLITIEEIGLLCVLVLIMANKDDLYFFNLLPLKAM